MLFLTPILQCPVMKYHHALMQAILYDRVKIADAVNVKVISLEDAPKVRPQWTRH